LGSGLYNGTLVLSIESTKVPLYKPDPKNFSPWIALPRCARNQSRLRLPRKDEPKPNILEVFFSYKDKPKS